jgi:hypothetical protein
MHKKRGKKQRRRPTRTVTGWVRTVGSNARPTDRSATVHVGDRVPVIREQHQLIAEMQMTVHAANLTTSFAVGQPNAVCITLDPRARLASAGYGLAARTRLADRRASLLTAHRAARRHPPEGIVHPDAEPPATEPVAPAPSAAATPEDERIHRHRRVRGWRWAASAGAGVVLGVLGMVTMGLLSDRELDRVRAACIRFDDDNSAVHWEHAFPLALPVGTVVLFGAAVVLAVVAIVGRGRPLGGRALGILLIALALIGLAATVLVLSDFIAYPGGEASTTMPPCGEG